MFTIQSSTFSANIVTIVYVVYALTEDPGASRACREQMQLCAMMAMVIRRSHILCISYLYVFAQLSPRRHWHHKRTCSKNLDAVI